MPQVTFSVNGHVQVSRNLRLTADRIQHLAPFFRDAIGLIEARTNQIFADQGRSVEKANTWAPLAPSTLKARERGWGYYKNTPNNPSVLRWTGAMQEARVKNVNDSFGQLQFTDPKAAWHQEGNGGRPPRRVIIDIDNPTAAEIVRLLQAFIMQTQGVFGRQL